MSVLMTLRVHADAKRLEAMLDHDPEAFASVSERGQQMGATYHRFYATKDEILVIDEWPSEEAFHAFFSSTPEIPKIMAEAGVHEEPVITFWRKLELGDDLG
jgi:heme-degrading monooxygenase HmoA